jgi:hypothetical protein
MPLPDATPTPIPTPPTGLTGQPFGADEKQGEWKEQFPDGGYFLWRIEEINGKRHWVPHYFDSPKGIES